MVPQAFVLKLTYERDAAASKVLKATWQRCRVHSMRNALAFANKTQRRMVSAAIGTVFEQDSPEAAVAQLLAAALALVPVHTMGW